jgi:hypothetical protein
MIGKGLFIVLYHARAIFARDFSRLAGMSQKAVIGSFFGKKDS